MYYVILSEGEYSDYSPTYYCGPVEITQAELDEQGATVGDEVIAWYESLPERPRTSQGIWDNEKTEKYDAITNEAVYSYKMAEVWNKQMVEWLTAKGFVELPSGLPEINVAYSEIPHHPSQRKELGI